jgi:hypothetical protein
VYTYLPLEFFRKVYITKEVFQSSEKKAETRSLTDPALPVFSDGAHLPESASLRQTATGAVCPAAQGAVAAAAVGPAHVYEAETQALTNPTFSVCSGRGHLPEPAGLHRAAADTPLTPSLPHSLTPSLIPSLPQSLNPSLNMSSSLYILF